MDSFLYTKMKPFVAFAFAAFVTSACALKVAIVSPVHEYDFQIARRFIRSLDTFCTDCREDVAIRFVVAHDEKLLFEAHVSDYAPRYKNFSVATLEQTIRESGFDVPKHVNAFLHMQTGTKHLFQGMKKVFGCLSTGADVCLVVDAGSFMVRKAAMRAVVERYLVKRVVLHNAFYVPGCGHNDPHTNVTHNLDFCEGKHAAATQMTRYMLGDRCAQSVDEMGWAEENYHWIWERDDLLAYTAYTTAQNRSMLRLADMYGDGSLFDEPPGIWYEESIYQYLYCFRNESSKTRTFVDTSKMTLDLVGAASRSSLFGVTGKTSFLEFSGRHLGLINKTNPTFLPLLAEEVKKLDVPTYALGGHVGANVHRLRMDFLERSAITWCTSFCTDDVWLHVLE